MQWPEDVALLQALASMGFASFNCVRLARYARSAGTAARRTGAWSLAFVSGAMAVEALTFAASPLVEGAPPAGEVGTLLARSALLAAAGLITALLARARGRP